MDRQNVPSHKLWNPAGPVPHYPTTRFAPSGVGSACTAVRGIEVSADHHDFIPLRAARNITRNVQSIHVLRAGGGFQVESHSDRFLHLHHGSVNPHMGVNAQG